MRQNLTLLLVVALLSVALPSCELIGDIFEAGFWTAIIVIVVIVGLILWIASRFRR